MRKGAKQAAAQTFSSLSKALGKVFHSLAPLLALFSLGAEGCSPKRPPQPTPPALSAQDLLNLLKTRQRSFQTLRGLVRVEYEDGKRKESGRQVVAVAGPDRFRLETFSPVGLASLAVCDGEKLAVYFPQENTVYRGAATPLNLARFLGVALSPREAVALLLGLLPLDGEGAQVKLGLEENEGLYRLELFWPNAEKQLFWFDRHTLHLLRSKEFGPHQAPSFEAYFAAYQKVQDLWFPLEMTFLDQESHRRVVLSYERVELNQDLPAELFTFPPQPGTKEVVLDRLP